MKKKLGILSLIVLIFINSFAYSASATSYTPFDEKGYYDYTGYIGKYKITLSIYYEESKVVGTYIYDKYRKEINIDGKITGNKIILNEYDVSHNVTGTFQGVLKEDDTISGVWQDKKGIHKYKFKLKLNDILTGGEYGHRYDVAGFDQDKDVAEYVTKFREYVKNDDASNISELISYPITVTIDDKFVDIKNKKQFIKNYTKIFTDDFKNAIINANTNYMFANWQGVMFGANLKNVWINYVMDTEGIYITTINN
ncbi:MAG TPA: hypothetical protein VN258_08635 [Mobilitalea sp.]|nr:hypothetical protein [Mobilitalea sp.]